MIIIAKYAANRQGHMSLSLKVKGNWYYFYYGSKTHTLFGESQVILKKVRLPGKLSQVNNSVGYGYNYTTSFYIKGNFNRAYSYAKSIKKNKPKYNVATYNCADVSIDVLLASMKYRHVMLDDSKTYALQQTRGIIRSNGMVGSLKGIFGSSKSTR